MSVKKKSQSQAVDSASDYAARIRALIEGQRVVQARALVSEALEANPHDSELLLQEVLKAPRVTSRQVTDADRTHEFGWIVANRDVLPGALGRDSGGEACSRRPVLR